MQDQQRTADYQPRGDNPVHHQAPQDRPAALPVQHPGYGGRSEGVHAAVLHHHTISPPHHLTISPPPHHRRHHRPPRHPHRQADRQATHTRRRLQDRQPTLQPNKEHRRNLRPQQHPHQTLQLLPPGDTLLPHRQPFQALEPR